MVSFRWVETESMYLLVTERLQRLHEVTARCDLKTSLGKESLSLKVGRCVDKTDGVWASQKQFNNIRLGPRRLPLIKTIPLMNEMTYFWLVRAIQTELIFVDSDFHNALICLISYGVGHRSHSQQRNVLFIVIASLLLYVPPRFFRLDLPQRLQGCFAPLHVTTCCRWDSHVILLLTVHGPGAYAAQDV
ncbi:uncharacterized protein V6R79_014293 [Siganus canaliculatus]